MRNLFFCVVGAAILGLSAAQAREFRSLRPVARGVPEKVPAGATPVATPAPVPAASVKQAVDALTGNWNKPGMENLVSDQFYDRSRLLDNMDEKVPRDAQLRVLGVSNVKTISQYQQPGDEPGTAMVTSRVAVTVRTQTNFNDPAAGFTKLEGLNEYIMEITERVRQ